MKGQKGIKILAPSPFKIKKEMEKIDPQTQKVIIGKDGKPDVYKRQPLDYACIKGYGLMNWN